jgi:hypothetical protein
VVYDTNSEHTNQLDGDKSFAFILLQKLVEKFKSVSFLIGGFENFKLDYEYLCKPSQQTLSSSSSSTVINNDNSSNCSSANTTPLSALPTTTNRFIPSGLSLTLALSSPIQLNKHDILSPTLPSPIRAKPNQLNHSLSTYCVDDFKKNATSSFIDADISKTNCDSSMTNASVSETNNENIQKNVNSEKTIREPTKILDFLYLGSQEDALSEITMKVRLSNLFTALVLKNNSSCLVL